MVIKCLAYYDTLDSGDNRMNGPAAFTKTSYVLECFERLGYDVEILSASYVVGNKTCRGRTRRISEKTTLRTLFSIGRGCLVKKVIARIFFAINYFFSMLFFVKKGDLVWVYHAPRLMKQVRLLKKLKKFKLILEVEEIYGDVIGSEKLKREELEFFKKAQGYIFSTKLLDCCVNSQLKPFAVVNGSYRVNKLEAGDKADDGLIHCVYGGTLAPNKGVLTAIETARYLDGKYHIHILGFGTEAEIQNVVSAVEEVSSVSESKVTYDGFLSGKGYTDFLSKCSIGLCTQTPDAKFTDTSFPSKVLVYIANGLRVVSVRIPAIEQSDVGEFVQFYDESNPESVAKAIKNIDLNAPYDGRKIISDLDSGFLESLERLLKDLESK